MDARWYVISIHTTDVNECILIIETYELKLVNKCVMCHKQKKKKTKKNIGLILN